MKVAVVNRTNLINFGSVLQVLGLVEAIKTLGYDVEVLWEDGSVKAHFDMRPRKLFSILFKLIGHPSLLNSVLSDLKFVSTIEYSEKTRKLFSDFVKSNFNRKFLPHKSLLKIGKSDEYYKFICGSDQIWCSTTLYPDPLMYLRFADKRKRIAYAPSLGRDYIPNYNKRTLQKYINDIPQISVREMDGVKLIKQLTGRDVPVVLDPTLLFDKNFWNRYKQPIDINQEFILCYFLNEPNEIVQRKIIEYANGTMIVSLRSHLSILDKEYHNICYPDAGPGEFINYIDASNFIFTDSYHGMLFSINFEKEFLSVERDYGIYNQSTRQRSILSQLELESRHNNTGNTCETTIDYERVNIILENLRNNSLKYLKEALHN